MSVIYVIDVDRGVLVALLGPLVIYSELFFCMGTIVPVLKQVGTLLGLGTG